MNLHSISNVRAMADGAFTVTSDLTDAEGVRETVEYISREGDAFGLAPLVWAAVQQWIADGKPVPDYVPPVPEVVVPDRVTARQFKLALLQAGLLASVEGWINSQSQAVQIAYNNSGTFVRTEPMMQAGFTALGFTPEQIDAFFTAAAEI